MYAIKYKNIKLIEQTIPKNILWCHVVEAKYLITENPDLYNRIVDRALASNKPAIEDVMELDDVRVFNTFENKERYVPQALLLPSRKILNVIDPKIQGNTYLDLLKSAHNNGYSLKYRRLVLYAVINENMPVLQFLLECTGKDFFTKVGLGPNKFHSTNPEFIAFMKEYFPNNCDW